MTIDTGKLRELALEVQSLDGKSLWSEPFPEHREVVIGRKQNKDYIAALSPDVTLALLDELEALRKMLNDAHSELGDLRTGTYTCHKCKKES